MALLNAALLAIFRSMGRILNTAFGWATILLFGKVSQDRQVFLSIMAFGSVLWIISALGIAFPSLATWLLAFVTLPRWVDDGWVRIAMLIAASIIPAVIGGLTILVVDPEERPAGVWPRVRAVLIGYPSTLVLALTLIFLTLVAPIVKARQMARRWTSTHIPVVVRPKDYEPIVRDVVQALAAGGIETRPEIAPWTLRAPLALMAKVARISGTHLVADGIKVLVSPELEVYLYPADLAIFGADYEVGKAHAVITERLAFTRAYFTHTKEAQEIEDELRDLWKTAQANARPAQARKLLDRFHGIEKKVRRLKLGYDEWEALFRERLILERALLVAVAGVTAKDGAVQKFLDAA